jgi:nucleoside-diphosphate-sugar epimerase
MKILVTGGLGFIGHNVVARLETQGHDVVITDTQSTYGIVAPEEIQYLISERRKKIRTDRIYSIDMSDRAGIDWLVRHHRPDRIIHLASFPRQKVVNVNAPAGSRVMSEGLLNLLEAAVVNSVSRFVYASSSMIYGDFHDTGPDGIDESHECKPLGQYGIMKLAGEWLVRDYTVRTGMAHTIVRPSAVYGPLDVEDRVISKFLISAMRDQVIQVRGSDELLDFTYVDDTVAGVIGAALSDAAENRTYNITRGRSRSLLEAAELAVSTAGGGRIQILDPDQAFPSRGQLNISAAQRDFGFAPTVDIEQGFRRYHDWLIDHPVYGLTKTV